MEATHTESGLSVASDARRQLLEKLRRGQMAAPVQQVETRIPRQSTDWIPLSCGQQQVWLHAEFAPDAPFYNESITIRKSGPADPEVLERAFNEVIRRHEIWRTAFDVVDGTVRQTVQPHVHLPLPLIDLSHMPAFERTTEAVRLATEDASRPFDLREAPLLRARLIRFSEDDHRIYLTLHHLLFDGVSIYRVLIPELASLYRAFAAGEASPLPELPIQYRDYASWQQSKVAEGACAEQLKYWREVLGAGIPALELPTDRQRPPVPSWRGGMAPFEAPARLSQAIQHFSANEGVTPYMLLLATFHVLLYRYSGQDDIVTGGVTTTRSRPELEPLIGFFLNTVVLRSQFHARLSFREFLGSIRNSVLGALANSDIPFDSVVRELNFKRDSNHHSLFQALFSLRPATTTFPGGWDLTDVEIHSGFSGFDLFADLVERPHGLSGRLIYSADLFDITTIRRLIRHWTTLLESALENPDAPVSEMTMIPPDERNALVCASAGRSRNSTGSVWAMFEDCVKQRPSAVAAVFETEQLTYSDLERRTAAFAAELEAAGAGPGKLVAISIERSLEMLIAMLAVIKTGAAYLPIDPGLPAGRQEVLRNAARPHLSVTSRELHIVPSEEVNDDPYSGLTYVLYTSGSTGTPKGVEVRESAVVNFLHSMQRVPGFSAADVLLAVTTFSFDMAVLELLLPLVSGGAVVIAPKEVVQDVRRLIEAIEVSKCTVMQGTPAMWRSLIDAGWEGQLSLKAICGGEALSRTLADQLLVRCRELWNGYGPTETTVFSTIEKIDPYSSSVPIGRPIENTQTYVLDRHLQLLPVGLRGELYIGGSGVARGYVGRADLTAERFQANPFLSGDTIYRTGDVVRWITETTGEYKLECLGRADDQVKVRGFRIEPQEIESALTAHPRVRAAAVRAWRDASGENSLAAYVEGDASPVDLRGYLTQRLPDYMVPSRFVRLEALPITPNGKVDRKALPEPHAHQTTSVSRESQTQTERRLSMLFASVLNVKAVGPHDDFFELGGHSLLASQLLRRIEAEFQTRLDMSALFEAPTVERMAALLERRESAGVTCRKGEKPLYWMYAGSFLRLLAEHMRSRRRLQTVHVPREIEDTLDESTSLEKVAKILARGICSQQPTGPYYLGGWCVAGVLAYAVAVELEARGADVGLVALLGAPNPHHFGAVSRRQKLKSKLRYHWKHVTELDLAGLAEYFKERARYQIRTRRPVAQKREFDRLLIEIAARYKPAPVCAPVVLFQGIDRPAGLDLAPGWKDLAKGGFRFCEIPGNHTTVLEEPNVAVLAETLCDCIADTAANA